MRYSIQPLIETLKFARKKKGLSQRAFSEHVGVPQGRLSKIENGTVDVRMSNLLELARALDLELMLVPKVLVPAVNSLVNQSLAKGGGQTVKSKTDEDETSHPASPLPAYRLDDEREKNEEADD